MYIGDDDMWIMASILTKKQFKLYRVLLPYLTLASAIYIMKAFQSERPGLCAVSLMLLFALNAFLIWKTSNRVYEFMDRDGRSSSTYLRYRNYWIYAIVSLIVAIVSLVPLFFGKEYFILPLVLVFIAQLGLNTDVLIRYVREFRPHNGRYTFGLKVALSYRSQEELDALGRALKMWK